MNLIGLDVALTRTGWAVLDYNWGHLRDCGLIETDPGWNLIERLNHIGEETGWLMRQWEGSDVAIEEGISHRNGAVTRKLAMAWAAVALAVNRTQGVEPATVNLATAKKLATGKGNATKAEMITAAVNRWGTPEGDSDVADAAWVAEVLRQDLIKRFGTGT